MNLYKIEFTHYSQKDSKTGMFCLALAENDEKVYLFVDKEHNYDGWEEDTEFGKTYNIWDDDYNIIGTETPKERYIRLGGTMHDEEYEISDLYYGVTTVGWTLLKENVSPENFQELIELEIVKVI
jgi:hypothetical protein